MISGDIINILERQSPTEYALEWDNVGLLVGRRNKEVKKLLLAVDATADVCNAAIEQGVDMIVTHHPMIFGKIKRVNDTTVLGQKILALAEAGICCYAMHTNFDTKGGMARLAASKLGMKKCSVLEETNMGEGIGQIGILDKAVTLRELCENVKNAFDIPGVLLFGDLERKVDKIAVCPGSGKSVIDIAVEKGVQCLITGDIGHHEGLDALEMGLSIIDASHYGLEKIFMEFMAGYLRDYMPEVEILVAETGIPYKFV
jgi:dinuclear metal center YbgI/SA1388 family protein